MPVTCIAEAEEDVYYRRMGSEGGDMVQTFDFGSIEEMDPSVGELFATCYIHSAMGG